EGSSSATFLLTPSVTAEFKGEFSMAGGVSLRVRPDVPPQLDVGFSGGAATGAVELGVGVDLLNTRGTRRILIGEPASSRLEVGKLAIRGGTRVQSGSGATAFVEVEAKDGSLVIAPNEEEADGFLTSILPKQWSLDFAATIGFDAENGLYFTGSSGLEIQLPAHIALGPLELKSAQIAIRPKNDAAGSSIPIELTGTIAADLGLLKGTIENVGVRAELLFPEGGGELGPLDFRLGFRPPSGVGLLVNTPAVRGGGYLFLDPEKGEYAGVLELSLFNVVSLQAVGLITTRMPDGSRGFSLLIILTAEFGTGIQLGLGFTLLAVGGLLGHNRTMRLDALALGIRTGAINSVLFPQDVVFNAAKIISDLRAIFPPTQGVFLIGPMLKLAWGTPPLVTLSLGVLIESPGNIAIVGVLRIVLPNEKAPLVVMQASFIGALEFDRDRLWFFAALFESRIFWLPVDGEMGVLGAYGDEEDFVLSIGGFHPRFEAPALPFPTPKRVSIALLDQTNARLHLTAYLAVTTNTCQLGGRLTLYYGFSFAKLDGELGLDALFQFKPFKYEAVISGSVSFRVFGVGLFSIRLELTLEGPGPNRVRGKGKVSLLFVSFSANFSVTWGEILEFFAPAIKVLDLIRRELQLAASWIALPPVRNTLLVSMRSQEPPVGGLILHPIGTLRVSQRAVPLDINLDKVGNATPEDGKRFSLRVRGGGLVKAADAEEKFAPAQFRDMSDADKLSSPAFQPEHAGIELTAPGEEVRTSRAVQRTVRYEEIIIDSNFKRASSRFGVRGSLLFAQLVAGGAVARSPLSEKRKRELAPFAEKITVDDGGYVVAFTRDNKPAAENARFSSAQAAEDFMARTVARDPSMRGRLHVIPGFELNDAA
ncbi:MAG TPA: DUF6603 domain-containing protein, partial [Gemmatimonadaceae bacterium]|nr:DUF6603 domain-containing protein [Gemmatimonadaceae bacterium]